MAISFRPALLCLAVLLALVMTASAAPSPLITPAPVAGDADVEKRGADVATGRAWKREEEERGLGDVFDEVARNIDPSPAPAPDSPVIVAVASPKGWKRDGAEPEPTPVEKRAAGRKMHIDVASGKGWKRDTVPTPRPFVS